ncbi:hypothetical protein [Chondrinema litorale]|uniref:hypothetical protein n=1 Tax=Chondrinema litorale TaxID=2994555 RepID=UPI0025439467|nr:hypothetical protein [Chondrinema litorale]UZR95273.1 hypothetical protein OQ292_05500 [Chondrinema litorale]
MKLFVLFLLISLFNLQTEPVCTDIKTGTFKISNQETGTHIITRTKNKQVEEHLERNVKVRYKVNWLDNCTYQLYDRKVLKGDKYGDSKNDTLTVNITNITTEFYEVFISSNFSDFTVKARLDIVEL